MSVKAGQILHASSGFVIDRVQSAGVGNFNIPSEKIHELGNFQTVATVRDTPDLSFSLESLDVSCEIEALMTAADPSAVTNHQAFDFINSVPMDIISPFKSAQGAYNIVRGIATPYLTLETITYRFGMRANATQAYTLRGDSVYFIPGSPYQDKFTLTAATNHTYNFAHTAIVYTERGNSLYALSACVKNPTTHTYKRLFFGEDYTNTSTGITVLADWTTLGYTILDVTYGSTTAASYPQTVHEGISVKPAAVRGKDIDVYLSDGAATPTLVRMTGVQSVEVNRRVSLDNDEEFGNYHYLAQDYDTADVNGSIQIKPSDVLDFFAKVNTITGVSSSEVVGPQLSRALAMEIRISNPDTGAVIKTLYVPDARFTPPPTQGRVQTKLAPQITWDSDGGSLTVYNGTRT